MILPFSLESVLSEGNTFQMSNNLKNQRVNNSISIYLIDSPVRFVFTSEELCEPGRISKESELLESQKVRLNHLGNFFCFGTPT